MRLILIVHGKLAENELKCVKRGETMACKIRFLVHEDIPRLVSAFELIGWHKPASLFEVYLDEVKQNCRIVWVALVGDQVAGYVTLVWQSRYAYFHEKNIPEIKDLNVLPQFQKQCIGSHLLECAEKAAREKDDTVGIGVGLSRDYGAAQRLYVTRGYMPDGRGVSYDYQPVAPGSTVLVDDDLVLWFTKTLERHD